MSPPAGPPFRHRLEYRLYRAGRALLSLLPEGSAMRLGALLGWVAGSVLRIRRREVDEHLAIAFPDRPGSWRRRVARRSYVHFGREAATLVRMADWSREELLDRVSGDGLDAIAAAASEGGLVLLTGHLGNWEVAGAAIAALGVPLDVVGKGMANRRFERDLFALRERLGMRVIEMSDAPKGVLGSLRRGRVTALLGDQNAHKHGVFLPFFGRLAATPRGPAVFALRSGVPVYVGFAFRRDAKRAEYVVEAAPLGFEPSGDVAVDEHRLLEAYHGALEVAIRRAPEQYFWQHKRWKTRPPPDGSSAGVQEPPSNG